MSNVMGDAWAVEDKLFEFLRWNSYCSSRHRLLYVATPKVACTSLKWWFAALEGYAQKLYDIDDSAESDPDLVVHESHKVAPHVTGLTREQLVPALEAENFFRFAVVRNPYKRVFSAWQSKLVLQEPLQIGRYTSFDFFHLPLKARRDIAPAFEAFLEHLAANEAPSFWDHHWAPQVSLLRPDIIRYSQLAQIEDTASLAGALRDWLGGYVPNPFDMHRANESLIPYQPEFFTARSVDLLRLMYAQDFDVFGYDRVLPASKETFSEEQADVALKGVHLVRARHAQLGRRSAQVSQLTLRVHERDDRIDGMSRSLSEHAGQLGAAQQQMSERDKQLSLMQEKAVERERALADAALSVTELDGRIGTLEQQIVERDAEVVALTETLFVRDEEIASLRNSLANEVSNAAQRDSQVSELKQQVVEYQADIASLRDRLAVSDHSAPLRETVANLKLAIAERDAQISRLGRQAIERNAESATFGRAIAERDGRLALLEQQLAERDVHLTQLRSALQEREGAIAALRLEAEAQREHALAESSRLEDILRSNTWRLAVYFRKGASLCRRALGRGRSKAKQLAVESPQIDPDEQVLRESHLFDAAYYLKQNKDIRDGGVDPVAHYLHHGWQEWRDPSTLFSTERYLSAYPDVQQIQANPLLHYLRYGAAEGREVFASLAPDVAQESPVPDELLQQQDLAAPEPTEEERKAAIEQTEARIREEIDVLEASGQFSVAYYLALNPELGLQAGEAIRHYCEHGWREGRDPSSEFNTRFYLDTYADIRNAGINPFWHYVIAGADESRHAAPPISNREEGEIFFGAIKSDVTLVAFHRSPDWTAVRAGRPLFKGHEQPVLQGSGEPSFYDPLDQDVLQHQVAMARRHGIEAFCFELQGGAGNVGHVQPVDNLRTLQQLDIRFCINIAVASVEDAHALATRLKPFLTDRRYIRFEGAPVIVVSASGDIERATAFLPALRQQLAQQGVSTPYLMGWCHASDDTEVQAFEALFDAVLDLPSHAGYGEFLAEQRNGVNVVPYGVVASLGIARLARASNAAGSRYAGVALARDNSVTRADGAVVHTRFDPRDYRRWLDAAIEHARRHHDGEQRVVFIDAWNDWNEGTALEPSLNRGFSRLNETSRALVGLPTGLAMPKVSVIVPNYRHEPFLRSRLDSIYGQTYKNIEVLLMDDCSPDQSRRVLDEYAAAYPEITRKFYNEVNSGGVFRQWAKGIEAATGPLVWIAESDDYCDERFLERLVRCFDDEAVLLAYGYSQFVDRDEVVIEGAFESYVGDLAGVQKWQGNYTETAHNEVRTALGIKNTIPNASSALFRRPVDMPLLKDESWLSMRVAGDWVFYLHVLRGGKIAYCRDAINFFRRYTGSTADTTYKKEAFYREVGVASRTVAELYDVPLEVFERCRKGYEDFYLKMVGRSSEEFLRWYDYLSVLQAHQRRMPNIMVTTMGFSPGGAEILPIRMANELKRQGHSVLLLNTGLMRLDFRIRDMVRNDVPVVEEADVAATRELIRNFGIEALNSHQWHIQKYPNQVEDVFDDLRVHVASLHGMIEHDAFGVTDDELMTADGKVTTWVYTADKNVVPFAKRGLYDEQSRRFTKLPNGMMAPEIVPMPRSQMQIPEDAFVLCCVSRAIPDKGWAETVAAVAKARELSHRDIRLVLVGNGPVYDEYCQTGVDDFVHLAGFSENSVGYYASADMGIMLTKFRSESFPLTIVDCLFAGRPYIATDVGDIRNMLTDEGEQLAGAVVELEDWEVPVNTAAQVIAAFASDEQKFKGACGRVKDVASRYKIDMVTAKYVDIFAAGRGNERLGAHKRPRKVIGHES